MQNGPRPRKSKGGTKRERSGRRRTTREEVFLQKLEKLSHKKETFKKKREGKNGRKKKKETEDSGTKE